MANPIKNGIEYFEYVLQEGWSRFESEKDRDILYTESIKIMERHMKTDMGCDERAAKLLSCFSFLDQLYETCIKRDYNLLRKHARTLMQILKNSTTTCIEGLNESLRLISEEKKIKKVTIYNFIEACHLAIKISSSLLEDVSSIPERSKTFLLYPSALISMYSQIIKHQKDSENLLASLKSKIVEKISNLYSNCAVCCNTLFECLEKLMAHTKTVPFEQYTVLTLLTSLCRLLSCTSNMKALISGWKALHSLLMKVAGDGIVSDYINDLNMDKMVEEISLDVKEGLDLLSDIEKKHYKLINKFDSNSTVICKRVLKMCSFCMKIILSLIDIGISFMDVHSIEKLIQFANLIAKCCISVSSMEKEGIIGVGLTQQLQIGLQLILSDTLRSCHFIEAIEYWIVEWEKELKNLEIQCLKSSIFELSSLTEQSWRVSSGGPLLVLCYLCMSVPKVMQNCSTLNPCVTNTLVSCLFQWIPYCHGLFSSQMRIVAPPPEGSVGKILPIYDWCLVSVCMCFPCVPKSGMWGRLENILFQSLFNIQPLISDKNKENNPLSVEDFIEKIEPDSKKMKLEVHSSADTSDNVPDWFWRHILAADVLAFISRLGSSFLCADQFLFLYHASLHLPLHSKMLPYLSCVMLRILRLLENPSTSLMILLDKSTGIQQETFILSYLSGAVFADADSFSADCVRKCEVAINFTADHFLLSAKEVVDNKPQANHWRNLHFHLQCVDVYLRSFSSKEHVGKIHRSEDICEALRLLWARLPVIAISCSAGEWLLAALLSVSARLPHLLMPGTLLTVLTKLLTVSKSASASSLESIAAFVKSLAHCTLISNVRTVLSDLFQELVSQHNNPWLSICSSEAFIYFAQHSSHPEVISEVLKKSSTEVKKKLQNFLLKNVHLPSEVSNSAEFSESEEFLAAPDILFYQQAVLNNNISENSNQYNKVLPKAISEQIKSAGKSWQHIYKTKLNVSEQEIKLIESQLRILNSCLASVLSRK